MSNLFSSYNLFVLGILCFAGAIYSHVVEKATEEKYYPYCCYDNLTEFPKEWPRQGPRPGLFLSCNCPKENRKHYEYCYNDTSHAGVITPIKELGNEMCKAKTSIYDIPDGS